MELLVVNLRLGQIGWKNGWKSEVAEKSHMWSQQFATVPLGKAASYIDCSSEVGA
jgi:hypothetical protein